MYDKKLLSGRFRVGRLEVTDKMSKLSSLTEHASQHFLQGFFRLAQAHHMWFYNNIEKHMLF